MRLTHGILIAALAATMPALALGGDHGGHDNQGWHGQGAPEHGPGRYHGNPHAYGPGYNYSDGDGHPFYPHVDGDRWIGHDTGRFDDHYHMDHPWEYGHFDGGFGRGHWWRIEGGGPGRFWFRGWNWSVAPYDVGFCNGWNWDDDDVSIYPDPDHIGWYLAYNTRLGTYVHVMYMGR